jgi:hypothetical protein
MSKRMTAFEVLTQGGSGTGVSHYRAVAFCPRMARLNDQVGSGMPQPGAAKRPNKLVIGVIFHHLRHLENSAA